MSEEKGMSDADLFKTHFPSKSPLEIKVEKLQAENKELKEKLEAMEYSKDNRKCNCLPCDYFENCERIQPIKSENTKLKMFAFELYKKLYPSSPACMKFNFEKYMMQFVKGE